MSKMNKQAATVKHLVREIWHTHHIKKYEICRIMKKGVSTLRSWESGEHKPSHADIKFLELILKDGWDADSTK